MAADADLYQTIGTVLRKEILLGAVRTWKASPFAARMAWITHNKFAVVQYGMLEYLSKMGPSVRAVKALFCARL